MSRCHRVTLSLLASAAFLSGLLPEAHAQQVNALPTHGNVASGAAVISAPSATSVLITQSSRNAIINWGSFSIGAGNAVRFENGSGATLNRVTGLSPSQIDGSLTGSGSVYLVNPSGVTVGPTGTVTTGGSFVASTHDVPDAEFNAGGAMIFSGASSASVVNYGAIGALGGDVALIARRVENAGSITAPNGTAALAAGYEVLMRDAALSDGKFVVKVGGADTEAKTTGRMKAAEIELRANGGNVYALAGNTEGLTKATGVANTGGRIFLTAGSGMVEMTQLVVAHAPANGGARKGGEVRISGGKVTIAGPLEARGKGDTGGAIVVTASDIALATAANLDASGTRGGTILVGGDYQGGKDAATKFLPEAIATARTTTVAAGATLRADGSAGDGGHVVLWSDAATAFAGSISATGAGGGNGGSAEVSGKAWLGFTGTVDLRAQGGTTGTLLLDPYNVIISDGADSGSFTPGGDDSIINVATLQNALATASVQISTGLGGSAGSQTGNITIANALTWSSDSALTLTAAHAIFINAAVTVAGGGRLVLNYDDTAGDDLNLAFGTAGHVTFAGGGAVMGQTLALNGVEQTLLYSISDLVGIGAGMSPSYALANDLDFGGIIYAQSPIPVFAGRLEGLGHTISNLTINVPEGPFPQGYDVGLFGRLNPPGVISDLGLVGGSVTAYQEVGSLAGTSNATITQFYSTGTVSGTNYVGGIIGSGSAKIAQSYVTGAVSGGTYVGGLVGFSTGVIVQSYAAGAIVSEGGNIGGIAGFFTGSIDQSYVTGAVSGSYAVGALVGNNSGGTITSSHWDPDTSGVGSAVGTGNPAASATSLTTAQFQSGTLPSGLDAAVWATGNGLYPYLSSFFPRGIQAISGYTYASDGTTLLGSGSAGAVNLQMRAHGNLLGSATSGANGYYYIAMPAASLETGQAFATFNYAGTSAATLAAATGAPTQTGFNLWASTLRVETTQTLMSSVNADLMTALGSAPIPLGLVPNMRIDAAGPFTIDQSAGAPGTFSVFATGDLTIAPGGQVGSGDAVLAATGAFVNQRGSDAVMALGGRWLVYAGSSDGNTFGSLDSGNTAIWNTAAGGAVSQAGNRYVFANQATLTITAIGTGKVYGDVADLSQRYVVTGYQGGVAGAYLGDDATSALAGAALVTSVGAGGSAAVNTYALQLAAGTLAATSGYALNFAPGGTLTVNRRPITVTADAKSRVYGDADPALTYVVGGSGLANGDALVGALAAATSASSGVGTYAIGPNTLAASPNYDVTYVGANLTVTRRPITITADALSRVYGDAGPALTYTIGGGGLVNGDALAGALATTTSGASGIGAYAIGRNTLAASSNYDLTYVGANLSIIPRPIIVTADALSRVYGDTDPAFTYTIGGGGLVNGDALAGALATTTSGASGIGSYAIGRNTLAASSNYDLTYVAANLSITPRPITVIVDTLSRVYGDANPALTYTIGGRGLVNGDALVGTLSATASAASGVGTYPIVPTMFANSNYLISYAPGVLTIAPRPVTVTALGGTSIYGNAPANPGLAATNLAPGEDIAVLTGLANNFAVGAGTNAGSYALNVTGALTNANYTVVGIGSGSWQVDPRSITIGADARTRIFGEANPALSYAILGGNLVNGDTLTGALATAAGPGSGVGTYAIIQGTLAASSNYNLAFSGADLAIAPRPITITADAQSRMYGDANPALSYGIGGQGLVNGDVLSGGLTTSAGAGTGIGHYLITQGSLAASSNYALTYQGADIGITARPITLVANGQNRVYGDANLPLTYAVGGGGLVNGDALTGTLATFASLSSGVGTYAIAQGSLAASANYSLTFQGADLIIAPRPITVTADDKARLYGAANPSLTYTLTMGNLVGSDTLLGSLASDAGPASAAGSYAITRGTLAASPNYAVTYKAGVLVVTGPAEPAVPPAYPMQQEQAPPVSQAPPATQTPASTQDPSTGHAPDKPAAPTPPPGPGPVTTQDLAMASQAAAPRFVETSATDQWLNTLTMDDLLRTLPLKKPVRRTSGCQADVMSISCMGVPRTSSLFEHQFLSIQVP